MAVNTAVVCVECQDGVLGERSVLPALGADAAPLIKNIARLVDGARTAGIQVVHATFGGLLGTPVSTAPIWRRLAERTAGWTPDHPATAVLPQLSHPDDLVLPRRHGLSPTWRTELLPILRDLGIGTIVLAGVSLNLALPMAAAEAGHEGFTVVVPRDAVAGTPAEYGEAVLANTMRMLARITTTDELLQSWRATPEIRPLGPATPGRAGSE
ncbi:cysteine hydrolase [Cryptosporangium aurantiacum]|uniref:Nicotinamidase-related amidase n=1 Tax=Cryptosporangium aurantiacum TaxID=134849 RepID=A0A1M7PH57_9ACTN|nr:cysteine hydrolase [Cryptosporangium aurantiacum]SHN16375.1 Nicotinamidase-related amidase [Cryptosporangium aurantiacum]